MLHRMPAKVYDLWCAYYALKSPEYRSQVEVDSMDEDDVAQAQADIIRRMIPGFPGGEASA